MNVLNISLDPKILDSDNVAAHRARAYGRITNRYIVVVPTPSKMKVVLSDKVRIYGSGGKLKIVRLIRMFFLVRRLIKNHSIDVIATSDPYYIGCMCLWLAKYYHLGIEIQVLGLEKNTWLRNTVARYTLIRASIVRALSQRLYERLHSEYGVPYEHMRIVTIYVDTNKLGLSTKTLNVHEQKEFDTAQNSFNTRYKGRFNFLTVSRLVPIKNITLQLQAVERLKTAHPNILLHIVGGGPDALSLQTEIQSRGLENHVILHGQQFGLSLGVFYLGSDCFLLTSHYEGWGMVIVEALASGLPVIMTAVGCADELVKNGESGIVIPINDVDALTHGMESIISDSKFRNTLASGTFEALKTLPDLESVLKQYKANWELAEAHRL